ALHEIRDAKIRFVKNLEAHAVALRDAASGQLHAHQVHLVGRHEDGTAAGPDFVRHLGIVQRSDDLGGFAVGKFSVQQTVFSTRRPERESAESANDDERGGDDADALAGAELAPDLEQLG